MQWHVVGLAIGLSVLLPSAARPQTAAQLQELKRQVEALEKQLAVKGGDPNHQRITEIGGSRVRARDTDLVVRIYDVSDLFQVAPPYLAEFQSDLASVQRPVLLPSSQGEPTANRGGGMGGASGIGGGGGFGGAGGGGFFDVPERRLPGNQQQTLNQMGSKLAGQVTSSRISTETLIDTITSSISPSSWTSGGGSATISKLGNSLVISVDVDSHDKIEALLALLRQRWGTLRTVSVRAYWLWLNDAQLATLLADDKQAGDGPKAFGVVKPQAWQALLAEQQKPEAKARPGYRAAVTCYNGQTVNTQAGGQSLVVTQIEPEVARGDTGVPQGRVAYRPLVSVVQEGAVMQVTPSATYSGKYVVLDMHSRVTRLREPAGGPAAAAKDKPKADAATDEASPQQVVAALDRPVLMSQRLSTTLRVPTDQPMLIGGMTLDSEPQPGEPTLYLFAIVSVQELRDDLQATAPKATEPPAVKEETKPAATN